MKTTAVFLTVTLLLPIAPAQAQFDSIRWAHQRESAWEALISYDYYSLAFQWDSEYIVRWTNWTCEGIHEREDSKRASVDAYFNKRFEETSAPFPEFTKAKKPKAKKQLAERH